MNQKITVYHNPRCSKSRATVEWLNQQQLEVTVIEYLKTPPDKPTLVKLLKLLDMQPLDIMRRGDTKFKELELGNGNKSDEQLLDALIEFPALLERPIVTTGDQAAIGRPLENVIELIDEL